MDEGVYTLAEVSKYIGVNDTTLRTWFKPKGRGLRPIFDSDWQLVEEQFAVSFFNLIEAFIAKFLRQSGIKPKIIRRAHEVLKDRLHTEHPFAHGDLGHDLRRIIQFGHGNGGAAVLPMDAISKQYSFPEFRDSIKPIRLPELDKKMTEIVYNKSTRIAEAWKIDTGVIISPRIGFGKPVLEDAGISTIILAHQYIANRKNADLVAKLFNIKPAGVLRAFEFETTTIGRIPCLN